jgi:hypothetical protein
MATSPSFAATPHAGAQVQVATANANRDGTGTLGTLITGVASGTRVEKVRVKATGTTTTGMVRLFVSYDGGTTKRLLDEVPVAALTPSATVQGFIYDLVIGDLVLPDTNAIIYASTHNAETFNVFAFASDF